MLYLQLKELYSAFLMKPILTTLILAVFFSADVAAQQPAAKLPDFRFFKQDKSPFANKDLTPGKKLLFIFFDVTCDHCQRAMTTFNEHSSELKNVAAYLISLDNPASVNQFMNKYGKNLLHKKNVTILLDLQNQFISRFGPRKYPSMFLYSPGRKLILYEDDDKNVGKLSKAVKGS